MFGNFKAKLQEAGKGLAPISNAINKAATGMSHPATSKEQQKTARDNFLDDDVEDTNPIVPLVPAKTSTTSTTQSSTAQSKLPVPINTVVPTPSSTTGQMSDALGVCYTYEYMLSHF